jgi:hypothetical protein
VSSVDPESGDRSDWSMTTVISVSPVRPVDCVGLTGASRAKHSAVSNDLCS